MFDKIRRFWAFRRGKKQINILGYSLKFRVGSSFEYHSRIMKFNGEPEVLEYFKNNLKPGEVLYDIGANVGTYSILASNLLGDQGKVCAFEPEARSFYRLCDNKLLNNRDNIIPLPIAIGDTNGLINFHIDSQEWGRGGHRIDKKGERIIPCFTLDFLQATLELPFPNHIKMDIEGYEERALEGMKNILQCRELKTLMIEVHLGPAQLEGHVKPSDELKRERIKEINDSLAGYKFTGRLLREEKDYAHVMYSRE